MHSAKKRLIRDRAERIGRVATCILNNYSGDEEVAAAMKYSWLMLRGPKSLLQRWGEDDLEINADDVRGFLWQRQEDLGFSTCELLPEEVEILTWHNGQAHAMALPSAGPTNMLELPAR